MTHCTFFNPRIVLVRISVEMFTEVEKIILKMEIATAKGYMHGCQMCTTMFYRI